MPPPSKTAEYGNMITTPDYELDENNRVLAET